MNEWLLGVIGVVFLGVLLDLIYPNGKTNAFCKSIFGIFVAYVLISPILKIKNEDFKSIAADVKILEEFGNVKDESLVAQIELSLNNVGFDNIYVEIDSNLSNNEYKVEYIYIDTSNMVLTKNLENINKYEVIMSEILKLIEIEKSRIIIYG